MKPSSHLLARILLSVPALLCPLAAQAQNAPKKPDAPAKKEPQKPSDPTKPDGGRMEQANWKSRHEKALAELKDPQNLKARIVFVGDSITQGWEGAGKAEWQKHWAAYGALNRGISGDRTEHVLWRLENGETAGLNPKLFVVMIGTNNVGHGTATPEKTADGVKAVVEKLQALHPQSKILLLGVFPRAEKPSDKPRQNVDGVNKIISKLHDGAKVHYLDIGPKFLNAEGILPKDIMPDLLHLNPKGYGIWAESIKAKVEELAGPAPTAQAAPAGGGVYSLAVKSLNGKDVNLSDYQGKVTLVVNVASKCGYTKQYAGLQKLSTEMAGKPFAVLGFPSNDFGGQEPGTAEQIEEFCSTTYGVTFPMFEKVKTKGDSQSPLYGLLAAADGGPKWNFHKYLVGKDGKVIAGFPSKVTPDSAELKAAIEKALAQ